MTFLEEMKWRGLLHDFTPGLDEEFEKGMCSAYVGYDPTAPCLTIGNYVTIMLLIHFQRYGHKPYVLMGGATGRIGDPSFKDAERKLLDLDVLNTNLNTQVELFKQFLDFDSDADNTATIVNNYDIYKDMNVLDFLRDVGKNLTVSYMMAKDSVKNRLEKGLSFTEFSYQLLQGYDFQWMYENNACNIQMGGSDQWGNITSGTHIIGKNIKDAKAFALTCPLLTKSDGKKFGKSENGNIWLDAKFTSSYKFYQFWLNAGDDDVVNYNRVFSLKSIEDIKALEEAHNEALGQRVIQKALAEELTIRLHGATAFEAVMEVSELLYNKKLNQEQLKGLSITALDAVKEEIPSFDLAKTLLDNPVSLAQLLVENTTIFKSNGDLRRAIKGNALSINKVKATSHEAEISTTDLVQCAYLMVENGKKNKFLLKFS